MLGQGSALWDTSNATRENKLPRIAKHIVSIFHFVKVSETGHR